MKPWERALLGSGVALFIRLLYQGHKETQRELEERLQELAEIERRKNSPLSFDDGVSKIELMQITQHSRARFPRIRTAFVSGMTIHIRVLSNSGLTEWDAEIDFNDYGHLTGSYWLSTENDDSLIPHAFAELVSTAIVQKLTDGTSPHALELEPSNETSTGLETPIAYDTSASAGWYQTQFGPRYWNGEAWAPEATPAAGPQYFHYTQFPQKQKNNLFLIFLAWLIAIGTMGYMLPWAIAVSRGTTNQGSVAAVNLLLGWTIIGWFIALIMAASG